MESGVFFFKQRTAYEIWYGLVGSEMCISDIALRCATDVYDRLEINSDKDTTNLHSPHGCRACASVFQP